MESVVENTEELQFQPPAYSHVLDLNGFLSPHQNDSALLILNQKIMVTGVFEKLWRNYFLHVCADGGANRLYEYFDNDEDRSRHIPNYIVGDLDSVREDVLRFYIQKGVAIIRQTSQYATDFTKSLQLISLHFFSSSFHKVTRSSGIDTNYGIEDCHGIHTLYHSERKIWVDRDVDLLVLNAIDGRFDQTIHSITQLYATARTDAYYRLCYLTTTDLIMLVPTGGALIKYSKKFKEECIKNCGLLPVGKPSVIRATRGLKWDVENWPTSIISGKVSSSNRFVGDTCCFFDVEDPMVLNIELNLEKLSMFM